MTHTLAPGEKFDLSLLRDYSQVQLPVIAETEKAICFQVGISWIDKGSPVWIPKSQMHIVIKTEVMLGEPFIDRRFYVATWLCRKYRLLK